MIDHLVGKKPAKSCIASRFIRRHKRHSFIHRLSDELAQGQSICVLDYLTHHIALTRNRADDGDLPGSASADVGFLVPMGDSYLYHR